MLKIHQHHSLRHHNTFGIDIKAPLFCEPSSVGELEFAVQYQAEGALDRLVIGEGSNLLFAGSFDGLIIHPVIRGIELADESASEVLVRVGSGEHWDDFVAYCVDRLWYGPENLSLIPGSVGAAPVQNIGAYGVEAKDIIEFVEVFDTKTMKPGVLSAASCHFDYRDSIFKHISGEHYIVTHVVFRLRKKGNLVLDYGNVREVFMAGGDRSLEGLRRAIISIRESKLPDPAVTGNAGSFFKNPVISESLFNELQSAFPTVPGYPTGPGKIKIPAAWLIEHSGWKGIKEGNTGTWPVQPLVIVNYGAAGGREIYNFSEKIRSDVLTKFGIDMEREVTVIGLGK